MLGSGWVKHLTRSQWLLRDCIDGTLANKRPKIGLPVKHRNIFVLFSIASTTPAFYPVIIFFIRFFLRLRRRRRLTQPSAAQQACSDSRKLGTQAHSSRVGDDNLSLYHCSTPCLPCNNVYITSIILSDQDTMTAGYLQRCNFCSFWHRQCHGSRSLYIRRAFVEPTTTAWLAEKKCLPLTVGESRWQRRL